MNDSVKLTKNGNIVVKDGKGREWVWRDRDVRQAVWDSKACGCGECVCCTIAKLQGAYVGKRP